MPTVKGCPKCITISGGGLPGRGAVNCKSCGGELVEVRYEISRLVWCGVALFLAAVVVGMYPIFVSTDMTQNDLIIYLSVQMTMELSGFLLFMIGARGVRKNILGKLAEIEK